ncbi:zinc finger transcription factor 1 [Penicillium lagena]|uniref:zinc finger transcription factor 1 n=1 Tax=Penicillium lagena TaxID=94218 RepID=UPI0025412948|nr:zinc finger transcription factor 1 [Penicillium lagena]KAJ5605761.1 zinc finger transcription factor 1 [Penicillium lagena]
MSPSSPAQTRESSEVTAHFRARSPRHEETDQSPSFQHGLQICLDHFFERHFASDFCSFDYRLDFEHKCRQDTLLASSVIALCGRYLAQQDAQALFGLTSARQVSRNYLQKARYLAKVKSDEPSVSHIQANLIVAMAELLANSGARQWLFSGTAIRMAEIMRLNKEFHQKHTPRDQEIRRRTFWACLLFDRALAYLLAKHRTINLDTVSIAVPSADASLVYQEETRGVSLDELATQRRPSDLGLTPYLIKAICLWSDLADFVVYSRRRLDWHPPTDSRSTLFIQHASLRSWVDELHPSLRWSADNYKNQCALGQKSPFVAMHFILRSASCVAHQSYLPQRTAYTMLVDIVDAAGWSYFHRDESLIKTCVNSALQVGEMLSYLMDDMEHESSLQTIWVAASILIAANTFLWLQYARDETFSDENMVKEANHYFNLVRQVMTCWVSEWKAARQWLGALDIMHDLYKAAYLGEVSENILVGRDSGSVAANSPDSENEDEEDAANDFRPQPGDGYPSLISLPNLQASVKFATGDTSAKSISVPSIWLQLSGGWPHGYMGAESLLEAAGEIDI